jgi:hypothetical protein
VNYSLNLAQLFFSGNDDLFGPYTAWELQNDMPWIFTCELGSLLGSRVLHSVACSWASSSHAIGI